MATFNILLDGKGLQAQYQQNDPNTLSELFRTFDENGFGYSISNIDDPITPSVLQGQDILMITSRWNINAGDNNPPDPSFEYTPDELRTIKSFVWRGGGLLLMSNHSSGGSNPNNITIYDQALANQFGVTLEQAFWYEPDTPTTISGDLLSSSSPIILDGGGVSSIVTNTCCSLTSTTKTTKVAMINPAMTNAHSPAIPPDGQAFALTLQSSKEGSGRAVFTADSGFIRTCGVGNSGALYCEGDNETFMINIINWLVKAI